MAAYKGEAEALADALIAEPDGNKAVAGSSVTHHKH